MSRLRLSTTLITSLSVALLLFVARDGAHQATAAEASSTGAGATWQAANDENNPFRSDTAAQWSPVRPRQPAADAPSDDSDDSNGSNVRATKKTDNRPRVTQASATVPSNNTNWQLPNGQPSAGNRKPSKLQAATAMREPQPFSAPSNATQMMANAPRTTNVAPWSTPTSANIHAGATWPPKTTAAAPRSPGSNFAANSAANTPAQTRGPAVAENARYTNNQQFSRPTTPGRMATNPRMNQQAPRGNSGNSGNGGIGSRMDSYSSRMWDSVAVAFQAPDGLAEGSAQPENLPLPGGSSKQQPSQMMSDGHEMMGPGFEGGNGYDGGPQGSCPCNGPGGCSCPGGCGECGPGCGSGCCGCEPGCGCGCCGEVSCACEPSCGCPDRGCDLNFCGPGDPQACTTIRIGAPRWQEFMLLGGVQGFKGSYDQERDSGNFGFHEGFNAGFKVPFTSMGYQLGYQAVQSQLSGDKDTGFTDANTQQFVTAGVFQRTKNGIQWGLAWDTLRDDRWGTVEFNQLRTEISMIDQGCHEIGFAGAFHLNKDEQFFFNSEEEIFSNIYQASDQYLLFYRFHGCNGGEGRFYGGVNDDSDAIVGADTLLPLSNRWSLSSGFTYLIPHQTGGAVGAENEAWNLSISLVWHWDCRARRCHSNCYRPLFNVADNGYLIVDQRPGAPPTD